MSSSDQPQLFGGNEGLPPDPFPPGWHPGERPRVYVASCLTRLSDETHESRHMMESEVHAITSAFERLEFDGGVRVEAEAYAPIQHTSAHRHADLTSNAIFSTNVAEVLTKSDGLIVHGWQPGAGVGQEFAWATAMAGLPVLWVQHQGHAVSRQILGTPGDITIEYFDTPDDLRGVVEAWLRSRRAVLEAGPVKRATRGQRWQGPAAAAQARWAILPEPKQRRIAATAHVAPDFVGFYLASPLLLSVAPVWLIDVLQVEGLLAATSARVARAARLSTPRMLALSDAAFEYGWSPDLVDMLRVKAEKLLEEPATRRLRLETPADWVALRERLKP